MYALQRMPRPRSLTTPAIAATALAVLERKGLEGLSMRAVAGELGVGTMSLYRYVRSREELEGLVVERVLSTVDLDDLGPDVPWAERVATMCERVRDAVGAHPAVVPLVQLGPDTFMAELFHGPSLAFKDVAMQILARLYDYVLGQQNRLQTILCATSGDTGGAAVEAFRGRKNVRVVALFPEGRISERVVDPAGEGKWRCGLCGEGVDVIGNQDNVGLWRGCCLYRRQHDGL